MGVTNFVRFEDDQRNVLYGAVNSSAVSGNLEGASVTVLSGDPFTGFTSTGKESKIKKVRHNRSLKINAYQSSFSVPWKQHQS
jgi:hypothetical protein